MISIITINYNSIGLSKAIKSVKDQSFKSLEYIVIDGNSTYNSLEIIKDNTDFISYWRSEKDEGVYDAMNRGLKQANSPYCLFLNSGDILIHNNIIQEIAKQIKADPHQDIYYGDLIIHTPETNQNVHTNYPNQISLNYLFFNSLGHPASIISTALLNNYEGYDKDFKIISDWIFYVNAFLDKARFRKIPLIISIFESGGLSSNRDAILSEGKLALDKYYPHLKPDYEYLSKIKSSSNSNLFKRLARKLKSKIIHK